MLTLCHAAKGGSGTTVITALTALADRSPTLLVDLDDELPAVLGIPEPDRPGVVDWFQSDAPLEHLDDLLVEIDRSTVILPTRGTASESERTSTCVDVSLTRWLQLASWCRTWATAQGGRVLIDTGTRAVPPEFAAACDQRWLVTRACYLSLRRAVRSAPKPTGVIVITEPGRALTGHDIEQSIDAPVLASIPWDPAIARSVDAGLVTCSRLHRRTMRALARAADDAVHDQTVAA